MNHYEIWCDLKDSHEDLAFADAVIAYLSALQDRGHIQAFQITRRKLGFGPSELGEFHITLTVKDLRQLEEGFETIAARDGAIEQLHAAVYSRVTNFKSALYRDFPDPQRKPPTR